MLEAPPPRNGMIASSSPIVLPTDILAEIFECCLPTAQDRVRTALHRLGPLSLTWVCKLWRELCLSMPTLWTEIALGHRGSDPAGDTHLLTIWLSRARDMPIALKLNYEADDALRPVLLNADKNEKYVKGMHKLLSLAVTCVERWSTFEIHALDISVLDQVFLAMVTRGSSQLKHVSFSTKYLGFFGDVHVLDFSRCPALQSICLRSAMISPVSRCAVMNHMTRLELRFCSSVDDCLRWIDICPALEQLIVRLFCSSADILGHEMQRLSNQRTRSLPLLKELEIHNFSIEVDAGPLLDVLDAPSLLSFKINMYDMTDASTRWTHALDLIRRSEPTLESFEILGTPSELEDIVECLRLLPKLQHLAIGTVRDTDVLLRSLSAEYAPGTTGAERSAQVVRRRNCLCPSLKTLNLVNCSWSSDVLASTISSRCTGTEWPIQQVEPDQELAFLEELHLDVEKAAIAKQNHAIMECTRTGLKIVERDMNLLVMAFSSPDVVFV